MFGSSLPPVVCRMSRFLFTLFAFVCAQWCWTYIVLVFFLRFGYPMLPVSLECPFLIAPSVFSNVYLIQYIFPLGYHCGGRQWSTLINLSSLCYWCIGYIATVSNTDHFEKQSFSVSSFYFFLSQPSRFHKFDVVWLTRILGECFRTQQSTVFQKSRNRWSGHC